MRKITADLKNILSSSTTKLTTCLLITLKSGEKLGLTEFNSVIWYKGQKYHPFYGYDRSALKQNLSLESDNVHIKGVFSSKEIYAQCKKGLIDGAEISFFLIAPDRLQAKEMYLFKGYLADIHLKDYAFEFTMHSLKSILSYGSLTETYTPHCRAEFADERCKIALKKWQYEGHVEKIDNIYFSFTVEFSIPPTPNFIEGGLIEWQTGKNQYCVSEIKTYNIQENLIILYLPLPYPIDIKDAFTLTIGCNKTAHMCKKRFNNFLNFRGDPFIKEM